MLNRLKLQWNYAATEQACVLHQTKNSGRWKIQFFPGQTNSLVSIDVGAMIKMILLENSMAIIICHNHPNGTIGPSEIDLRNTRKIVRVCRWLDVDVFDHLIFGKGRSFSFRAAGHL